MTGSHAQSPYNKLHQKRNNILVSLNIKATLQCHILLKYPDIWLEASFLAYILVKRNLYTTAFVPVCGPFCGRTVN